MILSVSICYVATKTLRYECVIYALVNRHALYEFACVACSWGCALVYLWAWTSTWTWNIRQSNREKKCRFLGRRPTNFALWTEEVTTTIWLWEYTESQVSSVCLSMWLLTMTCLLSMSMMIEWDCLTSDELLRGPIDWQPTAQIDNTEKRGERWGRFRKNNLVRITLAVLCPLVKN